MIQELHHLHLTHTNHKRSLVCSVSNVDPTTTVGLVPEGKRRRNIGSRIEQGLCYNSFHIFNEVGLLHNRALNVRDGILHGL